MSTPLFFCITHKQLAWPLPEFITIVGNGGFVPERGIALSQHYPALASMNEHLGEFSALFALRRILAEAPPERLFGLCHYRRFALPQPLGELHGFNSYADPALLAQARPDQFFGDGSKIIVPSKVTFNGSVLRQFASVGNARDLLMYFGAAVDAGAITHGEAADFLSQNSFMPACTAAYLPVGWFCSMIDRVEAATKQFLSTVHIERAGYERRNAGLCAERFYSLLLQQQLDQYGWERVITAPMTMLVEAGAPA
jgi:hypothetical protein